MYLTRVYKYSNNYVHLKFSLNLFISISSNVFLLLFYIVYLNFVKQKKTFIVEKHNFKLFSHFSKKSPNSTIAEICFCIRYRRIMRTFLDK